MPVGWRVSLLVAEAFCSGAWGGPQERAPTISFTASEVSVDFVARDKSGRIVKDLRREEILVFEDGTRQQIRSFRWLENAAQTPVSAFRRDDRKEPVDAAQQVRNVNLVTVVFADGINPDTDNGIAARDIMRDVLASEMHGSAFLGVFALESGAIREILPYTTSADDIGPALERFLPPRSNVVAASVEEKVRAAIDRIVVRLMRPIAPDEGVGVRTMFSIARFVQAQAEIPGRKLLFYVSQGLWIDPDHRELLNAAVSAANGSGVTIYGVNLDRLTVRNENANARELLSHAAELSREEQESRGSGPVSKDRIRTFDTAEQSVTANQVLNLEALATATGGELIGRTNDLRTKMRRAIEDARNHYEIAYAPSGLEYDGRFHRLRVETSRAGVSISARERCY